MAAGSSCTRIWRALPPTMLAPPTPGMASSRGWMVSSAMSVSSRSDRSSLWIAIAMIGDSFGSKWRMIGSSMFGGSCRRMRAIFACTSWSAVPMSTPRLNWRRTMEFPSSDVEVISLIPCTVLSASSTGFDTSRIMDSGDAPGNEVLTITTG
jgi:hypothetical protein